MRLPSYLLQNHYGIFYFRICFPKSIRLHLQKREFKKTLKTKDKKLAVSISRVIKIQFDLPLPTTRTDTDRFVDALIQRMKNASVHF